MQLLPVLEEIEAITGEKAEKFIYSKLDELNEINNLVNNPKGSAEAVKSILNANKYLQNQINLFETEKIKRIK